jgi:Uma2 family endonuclease
MTATAIQHKVMPSKPIGNGSKKPISWEDFKKKYLYRVDKFKYEWLNGTVEKTPRTMNQEQYYIWFNLKDCLAKLRKTQPDLGEFLVETDTFFATKHRRPDIAYFDSTQIRLMRHANQEPMFVMEIISDTDQIKRVYTKMSDYRAADVAVVWHVFPDLEEVHVYHGKNMTVCIGDDICSAEPVIQGFKMAAKDVFK